MLTHTVAKLDQRKIKNSNFPRAYGLIQTHKQNNSIRVIVLYINSPASERSDFYKNILTAACPSYVIKNGLGSKEKIKNITLPSSHIMASLDTISLFPSIPFELVEKSFKKNGIILKNILISLWMSF